MFVVEEIENDQCTSEIHLVNYKHEQIIKDHLLKNKIKDFRNQN